MLVIAAVLGVLGFSCLVVSISWHEEPESFAHRLFDQVWLLLVVAGGVLGGYELYFRSRLVGEIADLAGPGIVQTLLPRQVMASLLESIYGRSDANQYVIAGVLGGEGRHPAGGDLTISTHTDVELEFGAVDHTTYLLNQTVSYTFRKNVPSDHFLIFATCDATLRDLIVAGCQLPLFELWFVADQDLFHESIDDLLPSVRIGLSYLDDDGNRHHVDPGRVTPVNVPTSRWPELLVFFRESTAVQPRLDHRKQIARLRIFECDLRDVADDGRSVAAVERLTLRSTARQRIDDGFCYWQPPYPCYVDKVKLNVSKLDLDSDRRWEFRVVPFAFRSNTGSAKWQPADDIGELDVRSWLLPGHGVALLWREDTDPAPPTGLGR